VKFLIDAQLPVLLKTVLTDRGFECFHSSDLPNGNMSSDSELIDFALKNELAVITKDSDFLDSFLLFSKPKKLILVNTGNIKNRALLDIFRSSLSQIVSFLEENNAIVLTASDITVL
jgi:predicted nuclease of predicted toxin-antitoxin system